MVQQVYKYDDVEYEKADVGTTSTEINFSTYVSAIDVAVIDGNTVGSPVHVKIGGGTATTGSGFPVFDGSSKRFEARTDDISLVYAGSPTTTAEVFLIGYKTDKDLQ